MTTEQEIEDAAQAEADEIFRLQHEVQGAARCQNCDSAFFVTGRRQTCPVCGASAAEVYPLQELIDSVNTLEALILRIMRDLARVSPIYAEQWADLLAAVDEPAEPSEPPAASDAAVELASPADSPAGVPELNESQGHPPGDSAEPATGRRRPRGKKGEAE